MAKLGQFALVHPPTTGMNKVLCFYLQFIFGYLTRVCAGQFSLRPATQAHLPNLRCREVERLSSRLNLQYVQEFSFVSISIRISVSEFSFRRPLLAAAAALAMAGVACGASAQKTAPQLLPSTVRLVAGGGTAAIASGATCPVSGNKSTDAYGDGCLATEIQLTTGGAHIYSGEFPGYAIADSTGAVFFSDGYNGLVRRIDPVTGVVTAIAGGATTNPASGATCGSYKSSDANGDGCLSTAVKLGNPSALAFDANGNLYFGDVYKDDIREVTATGGFVTTAGVIANVAGSTTYGYNVNNTSTSGPVNAATQSYLDEPFGMSFDAIGNLYLADEGENAIEVINLTGASEVLEGFTIPAGTIQKIMGTKSGADCLDFVSTSSRGGCAYGTFVDGAVANASATDSAYGLGVVPGKTAPNAGYVYFSNEYTDDILQINPSNIVNNYAGMSGAATVDPNTQRGIAGSFSIGSTYGSAADVYGNVYLTDASAGMIWRVDQGSKAMYAVAGGATSICSGHADTLGDGCPALQTQFGSAAGSSGYVSSSAAPPAPGIFGITVDSYGNLFVGDTEKSVIREAATGAQFGVVGANQPTDTLIIHFAATDGPAAAGAYSLTSGAGNFSLGTASCVTNSDNTTDCSLPVTATPTVLGAFNGTLTVNSTLGATNNFQLSGTYVQSPITRTTLTATAATSCTGTTTYSTTTAITLTATLAANGPAAPGGTIKFFANGTQIGTTQNVSNIGTSGAPVYGATLTNTFTTVGTYTLTATYSGDSYFLTSTGAAASTVSSSTPTFSTTVVPSMQSTVTAGQTALYSFTIAQNVYTGTISFACSGLPANSSCSFSPVSVAATGCSTTSTVAVSIVTNPNVTTSSIGSGRGGLWSALSLLAGFVLALMVGLRRRTLPMRYGQLWMALALLLVATGTLACGKGTQSGAGTPTGSYSVTVTATGSTGGTTSSITLPLKVN